MSQLYHEPDNLVSTWIVLKQPAVEPHRKAPFWGGSKRTTNINTTNQLNENCRKLAQKAVCEVIANNSQAFQQAVLATNYQEFANINCPGDANFIGNNQSNTVTVSGTISMDNTTLVKVQTEMTTSLSDAFMDKTTSAGTNLGDVTGQLADAVTTSFGGDSDTHNEIITNIQNICKHESKKTIESAMTLQNIQDAVLEAQGQNRQVIKDIQCGGNLNVKDNAQTNVVVVMVDALMENVFDVEVINTMLDAIESNVTRIAEDYGDIVAAGMAAEACGNALAANVLAAGEAAPGIGQGVANAVQPAADVANNAAGEAGDTARSAIYAMILPLVVFIIVAGIVMSQMGGE